MMSQNMKEFAEALCKAQAEFVPPVKNRSVDMKGVSKKTGKEYTLNYKYADLSDVIEAVRPVLAKHGFSFTQTPHIVAVPTPRFVLLTTLFHNSGQWQQGMMPLDEGLDPQNLGSEITYYKRYALCGILGISADEDDDGRAATDAKKTQTPPKEEPKVKPKVEPVKLDVKASQTSIEVLQKILKDDLKMSKDRAIDFLKTNTGKDKFISLSHSDVHKLIDLAESYKKAENGVLT